jgi:hypothetical protein
MNTGGKGSLHEGQIAQMTAAPVPHRVIPVHLEHGGTQLQNVTLDSARGHSKEESVQFSAWLWMVCEN